MSTLKEIREGFGITQEQIAQRLGIAQPSYAVKETGKYEPRGETIKKIADAINQILIERNSSHRTSYDQIFDAVRGTTARNLTAVHSQPESA